MQLCRFSVNTLCMNVASILAHTSVIGGCKAAGHTDGCCIGPGPSACSVRTPSGVVCYCDEACHMFEMGVNGGCCPDISNIGCVGRCCYMFLLTIVLAIELSTMQLLHVGMLGCFQDVAGALAASVAQGMAVTVIKCAKSIEIAAVMSPEN